MAVQNAISMTAWTEISLNIEPFKEVFKPTPHSGRSFSDKLTHAHIFNININDIKTAILTYAYDTNMCV
jgi:hypothetical protein